LLAPIFYPFSVLSGWENVRVAHELAHRLRASIERELPQLRKLSDARASEPRGAGKWCPKEELGHLIDSATNNHIRFTIAALNGQFRGSTYAQEEWVGLHGYAEMQWADLVQMWFCYNRLLSKLVERVADEHLKSPCVVGGAEPVSLGFLIDDYIVHMQHHLDLLLRRPNVTNIHRRLSQRSEACFILNSTDENHRRNRFCRGAEDR
jgi:hypothetical protein